MPPMWALGWHSASKNIKTVDNLTNNILSYYDAELPIEGVWLDTPYMDIEHDFALNTTAFQYFES
jgi:alpha-glucosidase (family GH31 glycosyl hydrolase)